VRSSPITVTTGGGAPAQWLVSMELPDGHMAWMLGEEECDHPADALSRVCPETGDDRWMCHLCLATSVEVTA